MYDDDDDEEETLYEAYQKHWSNIVNARQKPTKDPENRVYDSDRDTSVRSIHENFFKCSFI